MPVTGETELDKASKGLAMAFGLDHIVVDEAPLRSRVDSVYTDQTARVRILAFFGPKSETATTSPREANWAFYWISLATKSRRSERRCR